MALNEANVPARRSGSAFTGNLMEPLSRLRTELDRLFDDFPAQVPMFRFGKSGSAMVPVVDLVETDDGYELTAELPGMEADDIDISFAEKELRIAGEKKVEHDEKQEGLMLSERSFGAFERRIRLPEAADAGDISAKFKKGVLKIKIPKDEQASQARRKIAVEKA